GHHLSQADLHHLPASRGHSQKQRSLVRSYRLLSKAVYENPTEGLTQKGRVESARRVANQGRQLQKPWTCEEGAQRRRPPCVHDRAPRLDPTAPCRKGRSCDSCQACRHSKGFSQVTFAFADVFGVR